MNYIYVLIRCASFIGRLPVYYPRIQGVSLGSNCVYFDTAVHELGHVIGFFHEHNRPDRDDFISVFPQQFPQLSDQFEKQNPLSTNTLGLGYDYASIMHYRSLGGAIVSKVEDIHFGEAQELSPLDIAKANKLYICGKYPQ